MSRDFSERELVLAQREAATKAIKATFASARSGGWQGIEYADMRDWAEANFPLPKITQERTAVLSNGRTYRVKAGVVEFLGFAMGLPAWEPSIRTVEDCKAIVDLAANPSETIEATD